MLVAHEQVREGGREGERVRERKRERERERDANTYLWRPKRIKIDPKRLLNDSMILNDSIEKG